MASSPSNAALFAEIRAKAPLDYKTRKALLSHWTPKVAKAICQGVYPDFRGTYEQHLHLLTHRAAEGDSSSLIYGAAGNTTYGLQAKAKGILFLWPYHYEDMRLCGPSHYMYYILKWERPRVNAILAGSTRCSERLNAKYLIETLRLQWALHALPYGEVSRKERQKGIAAIVKSQMMLTAHNDIEFKAIAYGLTHLRKSAAPVAAVLSTAVLSPAAMALVQMDAELLARR